MTRDCPWWPIATSFLAGATVEWLLNRQVRADLAQARWEAEHDGLTGLPNRAGMRRLFERQRAAGRASTLALVDLDRFKSVNDTFGHPAGDRLLMEVGARLAAACRSCGHAGRLGGDEFLLLLPRADRADALTTVRACLASLAAPVRLDRGDLVHVTASAGIAPAVPCASWSFQLNLADIALYSAKARPHGIVTYEQGMSHQAPMPDQPAAILPGGEDERHEEATRARQANTDVQH